MSRINIAAAILREVARSPKSLKGVLDANYEEKMRAYVAGKYGFSLGLPVIDLLDLVPGLQETIYPYSFLEGQATLTDLALLKAMARRRPDCRYLEIGTWRGESLANVASVAHECVSISLSDDEMRQMGMPPEFIETHRFFSNDLINVRYIAHNSHTLDYSTLGEGFDLIFIDGDHSRRGVTIDTGKVFDILRDEQSVIVWHDYGHSPETVRWDVLAGILDGAPPSARGSLYHVSNTMCAIFMRGTYPKRYSSGFQVPDKVFTVSLEASRIARAE
jgi:hypothetical protein